MEWSDWITQQYITWRGDATGRNRSISEFARAIGVSQPSMAAWMKQGGKIPRDQKTISALVSFFGSEIYNVIGLPQPESDPRSVLLTAGFPVDLADRLLSARDEYTAELASRGITTDSPEARQIIKDALARHGVQMTDTE